MNMNNTCCIDTPNCSCNTCNGCCGGVRVAGCGNPIYNVFRWNGPCNGCCQPEQCAINMLYEYLLKGEAAEIYVTNREFLDFLNELRDTYETKERVAELEQTIQDIQVGPAASQSWNDIEGKPTFATVATSGSYNDLTDKPIIPAQFVQVQADWNQTNSSAADYIKNKPTIPSGVIVDNHLDSSSPNPVLNKVIADEISSMSSSINSLSNAKQNKLVSGTSIKTINNESLLGSGNIATASQSELTNLATTVGNHTSAITELDTAVFKNGENQFDVVNGRVDNISSVLDSALTDIDNCVETIEVNNNTLRYTTSGGLTPVNVATIDTTATQNSSNLITSGAVYNAVLQGGGGGTIDTEMSNSSTNAVQNRVITENILSITPIIKSESSFGNACTLVTNKLRISGTQINPWQKEGQATFNPALIEFTVGVVDINSATRALNKHTFSYTISPGEGTEPTISGREYNYQLLVDKFVSDLCEYYAGFSNDGSNSMIIRKTRDESYANVELAVNITSTSLSTNHYQIVLSSFELAGYDTTGKDNKVISLALTTSSTTPETRSDIFYKTMYISKGDLGTIVTNPQTMWFNTTINHLMILDGQGRIYDCTTGSKFAFAPNYQQS